MFDCSTKEKKIRRRITDFCVWGINDWLDPNVAYIDGQARNILGSQSTIRMIALIVSKSILNHQKTGSYKFRSSSLEVRGFDRCLEWKMVRKKIDFLKNIGLIECEISNEKKCFYSIEPHAHLLALSEKYTKANIIKLATQIEINYRIYKEPIGMRIANHPQR